MLRAAAAASVLLGGAVALSPSDQLQSNVTSWIQAFNVSLDRKTYASAAIRDVVAAAWSSYAVLPEADSVAITVKFLSTALAHQLPDGTFPWDFNGTANLDPNSVEFISLPLTRLFFHYGSKLPASFLSQAVPHLDLAAQAVLRHDVPVCYTNIYSMRIVNLALYGQVLGNATYTAASASFLQTWKALVSTQGFHEYDSPTYTAVTASNLISGAASVQDAGIRAGLSSVLQFLLYDVSANVFAPSTSMAGSHSRDYDFLTGNSGVETLYSLTGLVPTSIQPPLSFSDPITEAQLYVAWSRGEMPQLLPGNGLAQALAIVEGSRTVVQVWGQNETNSPPGQDRYTYCTPSSCLGVAGAYYYNQQDKAAAAQFATGDAASKMRLPTGRLAQVIKTHDPWDSPYGQVKTPDGAGHEKPTHLSFSQAAVQDGGLALLLNDLTPEFKSTGSKGDYSSVSVALVLPYNGDGGIWALPAGAPGPAAPVPFKYGQNTSLPLGSTVGLWHGDAVIAWRMVAVDGLGGYTPDCWLKIDGPGDYYAGRWVCYQYQGQGRAFPGPAFPSSRSGMLLATGAGINSEAGVEDFLGAVAGYTVADGGVVDGVWAVTATPGAAATSVVWPGLSSTLSATLNITSSGVASRSVNGTTYQPQLFRVTLGNGTVFDVPPPA